MFWRPIDQDQVLTTWSEGRQMAWSSIYGCVTSQHFRPVNQILTSNKKATINLLKLLLGFKSILYLMPSTQHTQSCVFIKITVQNWFFFTSSVRDHWPGPRTEWKTRFSNRGTGVTRSWGPSCFSAWPCFCSQDPVMVRVAKTHPKLCKACVSRMCMKQPDQNRYNIGVH